MFGGQGAIAMPPPALGGATLGVPAQKPGRLPKFDDHPPTPKGKEDKIPLVEILPHNKVAPAEASSPQIKIEELEEDDLAELAALSIEESDILEYKDDGYIELVLKILGLICDGQNKTLQVCK
jgi:hypothetical protein